MVAKGGHAQKDFWCGQIIVIENSKLGHLLPHLDQARKEDFIGNLTEGHSIMLGYDKRISG